MSREIKFRAWEKHAKRMAEVTTFKWRPDHLYHQVYTRAIVNEKMIDEWYAYEFGGDSNGITIMQYTEMKDKNGEEIYEGDVIDCFAGEHHHGVWEHHKRYVVEFGWTECMWEMLNCDLIEVLGNIYENPELLKGEME